MLEEIRIPEISENVISGKVVSVLVKVGDVVEVDDVLIEFETEKALVEIPSTVTGKIMELPVEEGREMQVGDLIARIETEAAKISETKPLSTKYDSRAVDTAEYDRRKDEPVKLDGDFPEDTAKYDNIVGEVRKPPSQAAPGPTPASNSVEAPGRTASEAERPPAPASPSVRRFARELGVDIYRVRGSGPGGRITETDIKTFVKEDKISSVPSGGRSAATEPALPDFSRWGEIEAMDLPAVRRLTAESTATSWRLIPHVTQFDRSDITLLEDFLTQSRPKLAKEGVKLTLTAVVARVCAAALVKFPRFNASIDMVGNRLIHKKYVHIGIATATERGLLVPVIRNADQKGIRRLAADIADLADRARSKKIKPDEMEGGTFTISNQGGIGGTHFTPIVMWPQVAILGISRTAVEPVLIDGRFQPRSILPLSLSYDHRIIDGADAAAFLRWICEGLAQPFNLQLD